MRLAYSLSRSIDGAAQVQPAISSTVADVDRLLADPIIEAGAVDQEVDLAAISAIEQVELISVVASVYDEALISVKINSTDNDAITLTGPIVITKPCVIKLNEIPDKLYFTNATEADVQIYIEEFFTQPPIGE